MDSAVDSTFIRRAVEAADLAALRAALYQATGDPELASLGPVDQLSADEQARLVERAAHLLEHERDRFEARVPSDDELQSLMDLVLGVPTLDGHFEIRRRFMAFEPFPFLFEPSAPRVEVPEGFEVAIIGAGFAGIAAAVQLARIGIPFVLYERRHEVGGTWSVHAYPDIRVDTLSITYEFSFDEQYPWSQYFARGDEVRGYLEHVAKKYGVYEHIRFEHALEEARFDEARSIWALRLRCADGTDVEHEVNAVISAAGLFSTPKLPEIPGIDDFEGRVVHPSRWPSDLDLDGKRVAIVGNGSTGVQLLAPVAQVADRVHVFQRTPQWISPRPNYGRLIEPEVRWLLEHLPGYWNWCRYTSIISLFTWHEDFLIPDPDFEREGGRITRKSEELRDFLVSYIRDETGGRDDLIEKLVPDYAPMVRRPVVDNGWYRALTRDNVELVTDGIARLTKRGIETVDGENREVDIVVFATGFAIERYLWPAEYRGQGGTSLRDAWATESPRAYMGLMVPRFPNFFMLYGPNSQPVSGGVSLPSWFQIWAAYIAQCLSAVLARGGRTVAVKQSAFEAFNERLDREAEGLAFIQDKGSVERNYYVDRSGRLLANTPFETADLWEMMAAPDFGDLELD